MQIDVAGLLDIPVEAFIGTSTVVLGQTGSGKTNTVAVLIEGILPHFAATIIDPEGEYYTLKERFEIVVAGRSENVDVEIDVEGAGRFAEFVFEHNLSVVLDISEYGDEDQAAFLLNYLSSLWQLGLKERRPHQIILEEAQEFAPQDKNTPLKELLIRIAKRGRKRGLALISASQRTAQVDKDIVTQATIMFLHRVSFTTDVNIYKDIIDETPKDARRIVKALDPGQAIVVYGKELLTVQVRVRETFHAGATPTLNGSNVPTLRAVNADLLAELQAFAAEQPEDDLEGYRLRIRELEGIVEQLQQELSDAQAEIDGLEAVPTPTISIKPEYARRLQTAVVEAQAQNPHVENGRPTTLIVAVDERTPLAKRRAITKQEMQFNGLLADVRALPAMHREVVAYLLPRDDRTFNARELARNIGVMEVSFKNHPPLKAIDLGIIKRSGSPGSFRYTSVARGLLERSYPDLDAEVLFDRLVEAARR